MAGSRVTHKILCGMLGQNLELTVCGLGDKLIPVDTIIFNLTYAQLEWTMMITLQLVYPYPRISIPRINLLELGRFSFLGDRSSMSWQAIKVIYWLPALFASDDTGSEYILCDNTVAAAYYMINKIGIMLLLRRVCVSIFGNVRAVIYLSPSNQ